MDKISTLCYYAIMTIDWKLIKNQLSQRKPICLYDFPDRENETDVLYIGNPVDAQTVNFLRKEVGGPLAIYLSGQFFKRFIGTIWVHNMNQFNFFELMLAYHAAQIFAVRARFASKTRTVTSIFNG